MASHCCRLLRRGLEGMQAVEKRFRIIFDIFYKVMRDYLDRIGDVKEEYVDDCDSRLRSIPSGFSYNVASMRTSSVGWHVVNPMGGTGKRVGRGGRGRRPRESNDERVNDLNGMDTPYLLDGYGIFFKVRQWSFNSSKSWIRRIGKGIKLLFNDETSIANDTSSLLSQRQKASDYDNSGPVPQLQNVSPSADTTVPSQQELDLLFGPLYDEFFNAGTSSVNNSSSPTDNSKQQDTPPTTNNPSSTEPTTPTNVNAEENNDNQAEDTQFQQDEFINPFCTPVREIAESSSRNIDNSNMHTFYQPHDSEYRWTKDHPLEQVRGNPSKPVQTRRQLATDPEMCMFALTVSTAEPKTIKEAMANSAWIEVMQEELHHFFRCRPCRMYCTRKSTSGRIQFLGDKLVSWMPKKQDCIAMSSAEAEYVALSPCCAQVMWMRTQLKDYGFNYNKIPLYCDSQSAIAISCNPVHHSLTKHIHTRYYFIKEQVENGIIELYFVRTEYQLADMFTKALPEDRFQYLVRRIGMRCLTPAELEVLTNESA
ncbi:hypothetical protein Tco_1071063 [Tanacetum coccineum]|uniref:Uncharacterized protein n=1 Tax=Tanacetum coccineum TaxID=301880 RepID=A0ABQ5HN81_9ASTR